MNLATGEHVTLACASVESVLPIRDDAKQPLTPLSMREREVLEMIGDCVSTGDIAARLGLSQKTVETYRARIKQKLDITESLKLVRYASNGDYGNNRSTAKPRRFPALQAVTYQTKTVLPPLRLPTRRPVKFRWSKRPGLTRTREGRRLPSRLP